MNYSKALVIFSGGQDSTTCLYWAVKEFRQVFAITFDYGQRHRIEIAAAEAIAKNLNVSWTLFPLSGFSMLGDNSLTSSTEVSARLDPSTGLPNTFVPGRNLIFLTYAAAFAYSNRIGNLVGGMCETDFSGYPDCRRNTLDTLMQAINLGMESKLELHTPLMNLTKAQSVLRAKQVGALEALALSHTCYNGVFPPCRKCPACLLREKGFVEAGVVDPLIERASKQ